MRSYGAMIGVNDPKTMRGCAPPVSGSFAMLSRQFVYQSYFHSTLLYAAILEQPTNEPIVPSTAKTETMGGYGIGLHPSSECPVAVEFKMGGKASSSTSVMVLKPGMVIYPFGRGEDSAFTMFKWGLPFGWLGGGVATIVVLQSPDAEVFWSAGDQEILFHRARYKIVGDGAAPATYLKNWPIGFPWTNAVRDSTSIPQGGAPQMVVTPTRVQMVLQGIAAGLDAPATMRALIQGSNVFGTDSAGAFTSGVDPVAATYTWPIYSANTRPIIEDTGFLCRTGADLGGLALEDTSDGSVLTDFFVDIARYGKL